MEDNFTREQNVQSRYLDEYGRELPNPIPMQPPVGFVRQPTIAETMRAMMAQVSYEASVAGAETLEEADDFDVGPDAFEHEFESRYTHAYDWERDPVMEERLAMQARQSRPPEPPKDIQASGDAKAPTSPPEAPSAK